MIPDATLWFVGLDGVCLLIYLARRRRRRGRARTKIDYFGTSALRDADGAPW